MYRLSQLRRYGGSQTSTQFGTPKREREKPMGGALTIPTFTATRTRDKEASPPIRDKEEVSLLNSSFDVTANTFESVTYHPKKNQPTNPRDETTSPFPEKSDARSKKDSFSSTTYTFCIPKSSKPGSASAAARPTSDKRAVTDITVQLRPHNDHNQNYDAKNNVQQTHNEGKFERRSQDLSSCQHSSLSREYGDVDDNYWTGERLVP